LTILVFLHRKQRRNGDAKIVLKSSPTFCAADCILGSGEISAGWQHDCTNTKTFPCLGVKEITQRVLQQQSEVGTHQCCLTRRWASKDFELKTVSFYLSYSTASARKDALRQNTDNRWR